MITESPGRGKQRLIILLLRQWLENSLSESNGIQIEVDHEIDLFGCALDTNLRNLVVNVVNNLATLAGSKNYSEHLGI
jgi:hypothetical protein